MTTFSIYLNCIFFLLINHDFHVSKTEIHYKSDKSAIQITVNIFIDDLELALQKYDNSEMKLFSKSEFYKADSLIGVYLSNHLILSVDGSELKPNFIGKEISDDLSTSWCYLESENIPSFKNVSLKNTLLNDLFPDQRNIINVKINNDTKAFHIMDSTDDFKQFEF